MNKFNAEDMEDHRTVALALLDNDKYLFSINLKHRMITFPIGKVHDDETLIQGLRREISEELGVDLNVYCCESFHRFIGYNRPDLIHTYTKEYDFTGKPVKVKTSIFLLINATLHRSVAIDVHNAEPDKCGGIFFARISDAMQIAHNLGLKIADCVVEYAQATRSLDD